MACRTCGIEYDRVRGVGTWYDMCGIGGRGKPKDGQPVGGTSIHMSRT
jgi:hypothetical protein